jgi:hypothetical protein
LTNLHRPVSTKEVPTLGSRFLLLRLLVRRLKIWRAVRRLPAVLVLVAVLVALLAAPAAAATAGGATSLPSLIDNLRNWLVGLLAGMATLFLTIGGVRYLAAGGDPGQVEKAKVALKSAAIGYALAALAPLLVSILGSLVA